jgi:pSer/pThr/pTyr-binding forkhead associated (FHA) protein
MVISHLLGSKTGQIDYISLNDFRELTFGRGDSSMIKYDPYQEYMLSREQAKITPNPKNLKEFILTDLDSLNGTYINKAKLLGSLPLKSGDIIQFSKDGPVFKFSIE